MQVQKMQNNNYNPNFGIKLVLDENLYSDAKVLKKIVSTVEKRTADKKGTMSVSAYGPLYDEAPDAKHLSISFNNDNYGDGTSLFYSQNLKSRYNNDKFIDMLLNLTDIFKMRETLVKTTAKTREQIAKLQSEVKSISKETKFKFISIKDETGL